MGTRQRSGMGGWRSYLGAVALVVGLLVATGGTAMAQANDGPMLIAQSQKPKTLFDLLFGPKQKEPPQRVTPRRTVPKKRTAPPQRTAPKKAPRASPSIVALPPSKPSIAKADNARRVAVFGDSLASDLAAALARNFADDPNIVIFDKGVGSTGFVRDDYFDWPAALDKEIKSNNFDIAVVMIGVNDRQPIRAGGRSLDPLSEEWNTEYTARIRQFLGQLKAAGKPVIWVGLPPMKAKSYSAAIAQIASIQKRVVFTQGYGYVDIYDRFTDEAGGYSSYGPDLSGQTQQLRKSDGIHFTQIGADKLGFYVEQSLGKVYAGAAAGVTVADALAGTDAAGMIRPPMQGMAEAGRLEVAGPVRVLDAKIRRDDALITSQGASADAGIDLDAMMSAPPGRADAFGGGEGLKPAASAGKIPQNGAQAGAAARGQ